MEQLLDTAELAEYLHCSERHIRRMRECEGLPCVKAGRLVRFELSKVKEWLAGEKKAATAKPKPQKPKPKPKGQKSEVKQKDSLKQKIDAKKKHELIAELEEAKALMEKVRNSAIVSDIAKYVYNGDKDKNESCRRLTRSFALESFLRWYESDPEHAIEMMFGLFKPSGIEFE